MNLLCLYALALAFTLPCVLGQGRILGGQDAVNGQIPYQATINVFFRRTEKYCSASLIATEWLLTAAHCVYGGSYAAVYLGMIRHGAPNMCTHRKVSTNIIIHDNFNQNTLENDIALIKIPAVTLNPYIAIVQLPKMDAVNSDYAGQNVTASGWGRRGDTGPTSIDLQFTTLEVLSSCHENYIIHSGMLCATGDNNSSTCAGDSGGPLVLTNNKTLVGIVSGGFTTSCEEGLPEVFTRVTYYLQWIKTKSGVFYQ